MATQSIMRNIVIEEPAAAEVLITALEKAVEVSKNHTPKHIECEDVKGDDIKKLLGAFVK